MTNLPLYAHQSSHKTLHKKRSQRLSLLNTDNAHLANSTSRVKVSNRYVYALAMPKILLRSSQAPATQSYLIMSNKRGKNSLNQST